MKDLLCCLELCIIVMHIYIYIYRLINEELTSLDTSVVNHVASFIFFHYIMFVYVQQ